MSVHRFWLFFYHFSETFCPTFDPICIPKVPLYDKSCVCGRSSKHQRFSSTVVFLVKTAADITQKAEFISSLRSTNGAFKSQSRRETRWSALTVKLSFTSVCVVQEDKLVPVIVVEERQECPPDGRPELQGELALTLGGEAGRNEGDVKGAAEGRQRVDRALVVQAEDGEDTAGVLGANWGEKQHDKKNQNVEWSLK